MRLHKPRVVARTERADPAIEYLERLGAGFGLRVLVKGGCVGQVMHQGIPGAGIAVHECFGQLVVP